MIYIDASELGWRTYTESWLKMKFPNSSSSTVTASATPAAVAVNAGLCHLFIYFKICLCN